MTENEFKNEFCCKLEVQNHGSMTTVTTKAIRRSDGTIVSTIQTNFDVQETNGWIRASHLPISIFKWDWDSILDETKRHHIEHFALSAPIENFLPLNKKNIPNIDVYYK